MKGNSKPLNAILDFLSIGHVCQDVYKNTFTLGGAASYSSILAKKLGYSSGVLTSFGSDFQFSNMFDSMSVSNIKSNESTIFNNIHNGNRRVQYLIQRAKEITCENVLDTELEAKIVFLCPIADEVDKKIISLYSNNCFTAVSPQGWMRKWDEEKVVKYKSINWSELSDAAIVFLSREDVPNIETELSQILRYIKRLVLTCDDEGAIFYEENSKIHYPSFPTKVVDPTGAGDVFATGFCLSYYKYRNPLKAMAQAHCLAALCIADRGLNFLNNLDKLEEMMSEYYNQYQN